jgi:hypothetical protein
MVPYYYLPCRVCIGTGTLPTHSRHPPSPQRGKGARGVRVPLSPMVTLKRGSGLGGIVPYQFSPGGRANNPLRPYGLLL